MKIAVSVNGLDFIVRTNGKAYLGLISGAELFTLIAEPGLKRYPFDIVFFGHRMRHGADFNVDRVVFDGVNGDMFFLRRVDRAGNDFLHFLSAAHNRNARIFNESDDIAAMSANIKSLFHNSVSLKILRRFILKSIVFRVKLEIGLRVCAYGADFRRLYAYDNMTAIAAFPDLNVAFFENLISVKEVAEAAEVNRATFYSHFSDCYDLLESIENDLLNDFRNSLKHVSFFDVAFLVSAIYDMIERNSEICRILVFKNTNPSIIKKMIDLAREQSMELWRKELKKASQNELGMLYIHLSHGLMQVVAEGYYKYDKKEVISFVNRIVLSSIASFR